MNIPPTADCQELVNAVKAHYIGLGVSVTVHKHSDQRQVIFQCYHGGEYRNPLGLTEESRQRKGSSRALGCPFKVVARPRAAGWTVVNADEVHNHPLPLNIGGYSTAQKLTAVEKPVVRALADSGSSTSTILSYLKNNYGNQWTTRQVIRNERAAAQKEFLADRSSIQALFETISGGKFIYNLKVEDAGSVTGLFFTHQSSAALAKQFSNTFVMDCTYKTNRFGMLLLNIVGITATFETFNAGFAFNAGFSFLCAETEAEYAWALKAFSAVVVPAVIVTNRELSLMNAIKTGFPSLQNLLCIWHINKNIVANCKKLGWSGDVFDEFMKGWNQVLYAPDVDQFQSIWNAFTQKWSPSNAAAYSHFGTSTTSRGEGNHFVVKRYLKIVNSDLLMVLKNLMLLLGTQFTTLNAAMEREKLAIAHQHSHFFMRALVKNISHFALNKMLRQYEEVLRTSELDQCTEGGQFTLSDIHPQWVLQQNPLFNTAATALPATAPLLPPVNLGPLSPRRNALQQLQEKLYAVDRDQVPTLLAQLQEVTEGPAHPLSNPVPSTKKRGCPAGSIKRANQRDKSQFEYVTGNKWIDYAALSEEQEREHIHLGINAIKDAIGKPPVGWYRGRILPCSRQIAIEEFKKLGLPLLYDSDAHNDELPYYVGTTW
ncbi:hypothetical protein CcCBS67573_g03038 [Chytriomyces confervae]|uniref:MULE transposase domain-containing protein n=1 Tax=Chytriomyces confervae TaxID=246404 RepID=A0A507FL20_9FUNG|nr:hypothetical protein CcCBS67573_g03038 [Chytriomyces confervae]